MKLVVQDELAEPCHGWNGKTVFRLRNGELWEQAAYRERTFFRDPALVRIWSNGTRHLLEVQGIKDVLPVRRLYR